MTLHAVPNPLTITLHPPVISRPKQVPPGYDALPPSICPHCRDTIEVADRIRKVHSMWMHDECARKAIADMPASQSWLMLAEQVAARPSAFKTSEIRAIVRAVIDLAHLGFGDDAWDDEPVRPSGQTGGEQR